MYDYEVYDEDYEVENNLWVNVKEILRAIWEGAKPLFLITGIVTCIGYWIGHPEWFMKKRFCDMIIKNCSK